MSPGYSLVLEFAQTVQAVPMDTPEHYGMDGSFMLFIVPEERHLAHGESRFSSAPGWRAFVAETERL